ncbi:MAG TPA: hypothetical protein VD863_06955 [Bradyrhizobium sp.]|nr:hypothetical protein [Bradyrhizobium sp.]
MSLAHNLAPQRPSYPASSRTLVTADARTRALAAAMIRLNSEGGCTEALLLAEGFSAFELKHKADAARALANKEFVRDVAEEAAAAPFKSDDELLAIAADRCTGLIGEGAIYTALRCADLTNDTIARLWPKICARLAHGVALLPVPAKAVQ